MAGKIERIKMTITMVSFKTCSNVVCPIKSTFISALGGQKFSALPVALSLTATSLSAITMMGSPSEYYSYGSSYAWVIVADIIACLFAAFIYLPIYYNLGVTSIYEYVDMRFGRISRVIMTGESS